MALSLFLRNPACTNQAFTKQIMRLATFTAANNAPLTVRALPSVLPLKNISLESQKMPIANSVRSFRTSAVRMSDEKPHDHAKLWIIEKATSALMVPLIPLGLLVPNRIFDSLLAILITAHSFWGLEAIAVDYVRASIFGPVIPKIAIGLVYLLSIATLGGLFYIISHDIGIANSVRRLWAVRSQGQPA
ncbi:succinate dehydrogenase [ubiquinone] cytochrome b small subunit, mitochondrial [Battus philenor]|uniref:succinate dehydrogenase [ubiquinone] cytochrome b small subunit, mitochondrial n=1 Tax=Battus philenor TaxID=42288 RepID=UPI0035D00493